ncbi:hypothetical protein CFIMG_005845RAa [Ceratocystis fimbriata CBS 114723]|uniref:Peptidase M12A domain-containing protein n=1 Tax=Ceratocystis fimbriata CBS 114723 TaxID=1035309 RepID=A0A2C5WZK4_9PEZI|nr:hypothetical protein CFIMG_005845RAa [Ceratocystis fimbriata CBS 114723]
MLLTYAIAVAAAISKAKAKANAAAFPSDDWSLDPSEFAETVTMKYILNPFELNNQPSYTAYRRVAYFEYDGRAIINGDEIYDSMKNMKAAIVDGKHESRSLSVEKGKHSLWPNGKIYFFWYDRESERARGRMLNDAIEIWQSKLPWLKFIKRGYRKGSWGLGPLTIKAVPGRLSASSIGHSARPEGNYLLLGETDNLLDYVHQIGHVLGLTHEHQRLDRNENFDLFCDRIKPTTVVDADGQVAGYQPANCDPETCTGYGCNFTPLDPTDLGLLTEGSYDFYSVMQISPSAYKDPAVDGNPLIPKGGIELPNYTSLFPSVTDAMRVCHLYPNNCKSMRGNGIIEDEDQYDDGDYVDDDIENNIKPDSCSDACTDEKQESSYEEYTDQSWSTSKEGSYTDGGDETGVMEEVKEGEKDESVEWGEQYEEKEEWEENERWEEEGEWDEEGEEWEEEEVVVVGEWEEEDEGEGEYRQQGEEEEEEVGEWEEEDEGEGEYLQHGEEGEWEERQQLQQQQQQQQEEEEEEMEGEGGEQHPQQQQQQPEEKKEEEEDRQIDAPRALPNCGDVII